MTISSSRNPSWAQAFTLLEILLALGLCAILALVSVPAMEGWWSEYQLRTRADQLVKLVQSTKLEAERNGQAATVTLLKFGQPKPNEADARVRFFQEDGKSVWRLRRITSRATGASPADIRIDARGYVEPVTFRVAEGSHFVEYRFDFLTGHVSEEESSF